VDEPVTLRFLAEHLGLSPASISVVLNRAPAAATIPQTTRDRIEAAARKFGYRPNTLARSLRRQRSMTIGVMVPEISEGYASLVMSGIEDFLLQAGYLYFVASHRHRQDLMEEYPRLMLDRAVDGLIAVDTPIRRPMSVPVVSVSGHDRTRGVTRIVLDHDRAATLALEHLSGLGHRHLAVIKGQSFSSDTSVRWDAIRWAARRLGLVTDTRLTGQLTGDGSLPDSGSLVTQRLVATGRPFTALFAFNDLSAFGAVRALREAGLRVPDDVSVIGFDDIPSAAFQSPGLTTIRQPLHRMGALAAEVLLQRLDGTSPRGGEQVSVEPELVVRGSTAVASTAAWQSRRR
jgi:DNA-binding LacI/PurR family transcriptional regulator